MMVYHKPYRIAKDMELGEIPKEFAREAKRIYRGRKEALGLLVKLCESAKADGLSVAVISAHRTFEEQKELFRKAEEKHGKGKGILWLAPPGYSEHHTGFAFDLADRERPETDDELTFESSPLFPWLCRRAKEFGLELSFPKDNWQGIGYEPWHWRFIGDEISRKMFHPGPLKKAMIAAHAIANGIRMRYGF